MTQTPEAIKVKKINMAWKYQKQSQKIID
jgi:hypothetical protein